MLYSEYKIPTIRQNKKVINVLTKRYGVNLQWFFSSACRDYRKIFYKRYKYIPDISYIKKTIRSEA